MQTHGLVLWRMRKQLQTTREVQSTRTCAVGRCRCHRLQKIAQHCASIQRGCQPGALAARHLLHAPHDQARFPCTQADASLEVVSLLLNTFLLLLFMTDNHKSYTSAHAYGDCHTKTGAAEAPELVSLSTVELCPACSVPHALWLRRP